MSMIEMSPEPSTRAWMSRRDLALLEAVLERAHAVAGGTLRVLEWGCGMSTLSLTDHLRERRIPFRWTTVEHDRGYFDAEIREALMERPNVRVTYPDDGEEVVGSAAADEGEIRAAIFRRGKVLPFLPEREGDRSADLDAYVDYPATLRERWDVVLVDGRKRRRCLLEAARLLAPGGLVLLHDAHRTWYHAGLEPFGSRQRIGDEVVAAAAHATDFTEWVPEEGFLRSGVHPGLDELLPPRRGDGGYRGPTEAEVEAFRRDGVVALRGVLGAGEVERLREAVEVALAPIRGEDHRQGFFLRSMCHGEVPEIDTLCRRSQAPRAVGALLGERRVYLYEDSVMVKEPLSPRATPWHQDRPYYPAELGAVATVWFALDVVRRDSGAVRYVRGSHRWPERFTQPPTFSTRSPDMPDFDADPHRYEVVSFDLEPGDCLVHHGMTVHGAGPNLSPTMRRRAVAISYCSPPADAAGGRLEGYPEVWSAAE